MPMSLSRDLTLIRRTKAERITAAWRNCSTDAIDRWNLRVPNRSYDRSCTALQMRNWKIRATS